MISINFLFGVYRLLSDLVCFFTSIRSLLDRFVLKRNVFLPKLFLKRSFLKTIYIKTVISLFLLIVVLACSTKKNTFVSRNFHALTTKYNVLFNGEEALKKGALELQMSYIDDYWDILPLELLDIADEAMMPGDKKNPNFERAENKAVKAVQKHSINISGFEYNYQIDEAFFVLGKARYYDQRFLPALEAFNYVLYKYPNSSTIDELRVWREKTNMQLGNHSVTIENMSRLLQKDDLKKRVRKEAEKVLTQTYINIKEFDSAVVHVNKALLFSKNSKEKARLRFIKAQLFDVLQQKDSALATYQTVIDMKRKSPRIYIIYAHVGQVAFFDFENGDKTAFVKKFTDLIADKENKNYTGILNHQLGIFYDRTNQLDSAKEYYNISLKAKSDDKYLRASNYRNLAEINFGEAKYPEAGKYFDSTLVNLNEKSREYRVIKKKKTNLLDVIKYEQIALKKDSIIQVVSMSDAQREAYYTKHIEKLKLQEAEAKEKQAQATNPIAEVPKTVKKSFSTPTGADVFYFYNQRAVDLGKADFKKKWGDRPLKDNWRHLSKSQLNPQATVEAQSIDTTLIKTPEIEDKKHQLSTYIDQIPSDTITIDSLKIDRNFAYYQLGMIYKNKYKRYDLAEYKYNKLLSFDPDPKYILPVLYNMYKMYAEIGNPKSDMIKNRIIRDYPDTRYAQILQNATLSKAEDSPDIAYEKLKKLYDNQQHSQVLDEIENQLIQYEADPIVSKLELLKAYCLGKLDGLAAYKKALTFVAFNFPNTEEGKGAAEVLNMSVRELEQMQYKKSDGGEWKMIFVYGVDEAESLKKDVEKIVEFVKDIKSINVTHTVDALDRNTQLFVLHGFISEESSAITMNRIKDDKKLKKLKIRSGIVISKHNYKTLQLNKNINDYIEYTKK